MRKNNILKISAFLSFLLFITQVKSQEIITPNFFASQEEVSPFFNSSLLNNYSAINLGSQMQLNSSSDFRHFYLFGGGKLGKKQNRGIGLGLLTSQEGKILSENRLNGSYWNNIKLSKLTTFTISTQVGFINQSIKATKSTPAVNSFTPEINIGTAILMKNTLIGASINQLGSFSKKFNTAKISYPLFISIYANQSINLNTNLQLNLTGNAKIIPDHSRDMRLKSSLTFYKVITTGVSIGTDGISGSLKWQKIPFLQKKGFVSFTYLVPMFNDRINLFAPFQLNLGYKLNE